MAEYYTEFSEVISKLTDEEAAWLGDQFQFFEVYGNQAYAEDQVPASLADTQPDWQGCLAYRDMDDYDPDWAPEPHFDYEFGRSNDGGQHLWIGSGEDGRLECVAHLVQKFLKQFRPAECWSLTYAARCSKQRVGEFGGGALFVTAENVVWNAAHDFVEQQRRALAQTQNANDPSKTKLVITASDGLIDGVYCSDVDAEAVLVDWDTEDNTLGDPGILEVETRCGHLELVNVELQKVRPLEKLLGTNDAAALHQAGIDLAAH